MTLKTRLALLKYSYFEGWCVQFPVFPPAFSLNFIVSQLSLTTTTVPISLFEVTAHQWLSGPLLLRLPRVGRRRCGARRFHHRRPVRTSCGAAVIQPEMGLSYWGLMGIASPGENLVPIKDNFKGFFFFLFSGGGATPERRHFSAVPVFTSSHLISFKDKNSLSYSCDIPLGPFDLSVVPSVRLITWFGVFY